MTTMNSKLLVAAFTTAALAMGATTAKADHYYRRPYGTGYGGYASAYYSSPVYARAPVYAAPAYGYGYGNGYGCAPYRPVAYAQPVYYPAPRYYAPAPVYPSYYSPSSFSFGFGYSKGGCGGYGGYGGYYGRGGNRGHASHHGGGFAIRVGG